MPIPVSVTLNSDDIRQLTAAVVALKGAIYEGAKKMAAIDDLTAAVAAMADADTALKASVDAAAAKISDLAAQLAAALAGGDTAAIQALIPQVQQVATDMSADKAALDKAVTP